MLRIWCDVGGTFTDTILDASSALSGSQRSRLKVLSSGVTHASIMKWIDPSCVQLNLSSTSSDFWNTAVIRFRGQNGELLGETRVVGSESSSNYFRVALVQSSALIEAAVSVDLVCGFEAPVLAAHLLLDIPIAKPLPDHLDVRLGTTRGTNALLTRNGSRTALLLTSPFEDLLLIGHQDRPELFSLEVHKRAPIYEKVSCVHERIRSTGEIETHVDLPHAKKVLEQMQADGIESIAISFLNAYANPIHEQKVAAIARSLGFANVSVSSEISPIAKWVDRCETTVIDAYLGPTVRSYLNRLHQQFGGKDGQRLRVMTSAGGLVDFRSYGGKDSVLSGPAGGVVALDRLSLSMGNTKGPQLKRNRSKLIGLDMGGTSTDVCRISEAPTLKFETVKANVRLLTPALDIHTVASGGGSDCSFDGVQWHVGPQSAGANPGPACYGRGGPLTVTDLNLLTGRLPEDALPFAVDLAAARKALNRLCREARLPEGDEAAIELAAGLRRIANEQMAAAVRSITIAEGAEPSEHMLVGFGGAAGQHICEIASLLGISTILDPLDAGILSALGMGLAAITRTTSKPVYQPLVDCHADGLDSEFSQLEEAAASELQNEGLDLSAIQFKRTIEMRTVGTDRTIPLEWSSFESIPDDFHNAHATRYGYSRRELPIEITAIRVLAQVESDVRWPTPTVAELEQLSQILDLENKLPPSSEHRMYDGTWSSARIARRSDLVSGTLIHGPAIVLSASHTTVIEAGWVGMVCHDGSIVATQRKKATPTAIGEKRTAAQAQVFREVLAQRFAAIASQMGIVLEQTAISVNIRDRRDFSCAVFDRHGQLLANAPHVPVHLGAMQATVEHAIKSFPEKLPGDCYITNDPYCGGSHLPDVTLVTPVFAKDRSEIVFYVANRAHHAEIGGIAPGSMTPKATRLVEEGVIIPMQHLTKGGADCSNEILDFLSKSPFPSRLVKQNMADLAAQAAANSRGVSALQDLVDELGFEEISNTIKSILSLTETKVKHWIASLSPRTLSFSDQLDDGTTIAVKLDFRDGQLVIDFEGSGPVSRENFNASIGIVHAAVLYVVRCMIKDDFPMNSGAFRPIKIVVPHSILNPVLTDRLEDRPAVGAGNVETSQRVVDVLLGALGVCGASQGTMNNLLMGNHEFGFYETLGGGTGATEAADGTDAVHSHMTNTRLTDPEVIEKRYPIVLRQLRVRQGSGGAGKRRGGNGMIRELEFQTDLTVSLITSRRQPYSPYGQGGGENGESGCNFWIGAAGEEKELAASVQMNVVAGDRIRIETPGGGGFGNV